MDPSPPVLALDASHPAFEAVRALLPGRRLLGLLWPLGGSSTELEALRVACGLEALATAPPCFVYRASTPGGLALGDPRPEGLARSLLGLGPDDALPGVRDFQEPQAPGAASTLVLVGPMASGKSSLGRALARRAGQGFVDSDEVIAAEAGIGIPEIFAQEGEAGFRAQEEAALAALLDGRPRILATGGGAILSPATRALLGARATVVWLHASPEDQAARAGKGAGRPLLAGQDPQARLRALYEIRRPLYASVAHYLLPTGGSNPDTLAEVLYEAILRSSPRLR